MKYMGSKARIAKDILPIILANRKQGQFYVEPFVGGCNIMDKVEGNRIGADLNKYLIAMWKFLVQDEYVFPNYIGRTTYSSWRDKWHKRNSNELGIDDAMIGWIGFMGSFNGRFFDGGYSGHNVEIKGGVRNYISEQINNTLSQVEKLKGVDFRWSDYKSLDIPPESIIYCDPPYKGTTQYHLSKCFDYNRFYMWCRKMKSEGHTIFVSEYDMPHDFKLMWEKPVKTSLNQKITKIGTERLYKL